MLVALIAVSCMVGPGAAVACGTHPPAVQSKIDAAEATEIRKLARVAADDADRILIGTVTDLARAAWQSGEFGSISLDIEETLKGDSSPNATARWKDRFVYSCRQSEMFHDVGFRISGRFIVYIRDGEVVRSAAADHLRSGLLSLEEERAIAAAGSGS